MEEEIFPRDSGEIDAIARLRAVLRGFDTATRLRLLRFCLRQEELTETRNKTED